MGDPNDPITYGADCDQCFAIGKTPSVLAVTVSGVHSEPGYANCNGVYMCEQDDREACRYSGSKGSGEDAFYITFWFRLPSSFCVIVQLPQQPVFSGYGETPCDGTIPNWYQEGFGPYYGGTASASSGNSSSFYNYEGGLFPVPYALLELTSEDLTMKCIRTVHTPDKTNFVIKVEK